MKKYAVMGNPIAHSKSPEIHQAFARQFNIEIEYQRILVPINGLASALKKFSAEGGSGVNITLPFKEDAFALMQEVGEVARQAQAVNTISFLEHGLMRGDNTDGIGLIRDLIHKQVLVKNQEVAMIGAGGAARGVIGMIINQQPKRIILINRTREKAKAIQQKYAEFSNLEICSLEDIPHQKFDLVINTTSAGTKGEELNLPEFLVKEAICYDLAYGEAAKPFLNWAKNLGARNCFNGWGMLVEQAAESFYIWHGKRPNTSNCRESHG